MKNGFRAAGVLKLCAVLLLAVNASLPAAAQDTLDRIRQSGEITLGHQDAVFPFAYYDEKQNIAGYSMDICRRVAEATRNALHLKVLAVKYNPALFANRASLLSQGTIDLDCGPAVISSEKRGQTAFSLPYFVSSIRFLSKKSAGLRRASDLKGKAVMTVAGTRALKEASALNELRKLGLSIGTAKNARQAFQALAAGNVAALFLDDVMLHVLGAESGDREAWVVSEEALATEFYGLMLRRDDAKLLEIVNDTLRALYRDGELRRIHDKWFLGPVRTPGGSTAKLGIPMPDALGQVIAPAAVTGDARKR